MNEKREYVICSPSYVHNCGGIKALWKLCHMINEKGYKAYITGNNPPPEFNTNFIGNLDNKKLKELQLETGIIIYPDIVPSNPARFTHVVKWFLGATQPYPEGQFPLSFSKMHQVITKCDNTLMTWHIEDFFKEPEKENRTKTCCYPGKGGGIDTNPIIELTGNANNSVNPSGCVRITASFPYPRQNLARLLQESKVFYTYDNLTVLIDEARLCGCPVIVMGEYMMSKENFIKNNPFGVDGVGFYGENYDLEELKSQLPKFLERYKQREEQTEKEIDNFIEKTQEWNKESKYVNDPGNFKPTLNGIKKLAIWGTR